MVETTEAMTTIMMGRVMMMMMPVVINISS